MESIQTDKRTDFVLQYEVKSENTICLIGLSMRLNAIFPCLSKRVE